MTAPVRPIRPKCPDCGFAVFNRRYPRCEKCGVVLPTSIAFGPAELATLREKDAADERRRAEWMARARQRAANTNGGIGAEVGSGLIALLGDIGD